MDELKRYIQDHAGNLDVDEPGAQVWEQVRQRSASQKTKLVTISRIRWAAAACLLLLAGIGSWQLFRTQENSATELAGKTQQTAPAIEPLPAPVADNNTTQLAQNEPATSKQGTTGRKKQKTTAETAIEHSLSNLENSFTQVINLQRERVSSIPMYAESPDYFKDFTIQIHEMEKEEKQIKSDIARRGMTDASLDQLINLYQQKLAVLKQLQLEMTKTNNRYKQHSGPVDATQAYFLKI